MKPGAAIIATSSETGIKGIKRMPDYSATKGAINAFTKSLAIDLIDRKIRVNAVAPGPVRRNYRRLTDFAVMALTTASVIMFRSMRVSEY